MDHMVFKLCQVQLGELLGGDGITQIIIDVGWVVKCKHVIGPKTIMSRKMNMCSIVLHFYFINLYSLVVVFYTCDIAYFKVMSL